MVGYDRRGHGKSEGKRGHTTNYEALLEEIDQLLTHTRERYAGRPVYIYGHSQGGHLVLSYMLRRKPDVKGIIATAPCCDDSCWKVDASVGTEFFAKQ